MRARWVSLGIVLLACACSAAENVKVPLKVLYVGHAGTRRASAFDDFLKTRFESVTIAPRDGFNPRRADSVDVVLLDWSQYDLAGANGTVDLKRLRSLKSPLGDRDSWTKPIVLLGSATLLLASEWQTNGAYG